MGIRVNTSGDGAVAFIYGGTGNVIKFEIDLSTLDTSDADPNNWNVGGISFDRVVAHEMVHLLQTKIRMVRILLEMVPGELGSKKGLLSSFMGLMKEFMAFWEIIRQMTKFVNYLTR